MLAAAAICAWGAFRRPAPVRIVVAQLRRRRGDRPGVAAGLRSGHGFGVGAGRAGDGRRRRDRLRLRKRARGRSRDRRRHASIRRPPRRCSRSRWSPRASRRRSTRTTTAGPPARSSTPTSWRPTCVVVLGLAAGDRGLRPGSPLRLLAGLTLLAGVPAFAATYSRWGFFAAFAGAAFFAAVAGGRRVWLGVAASPVVVAVLLVAGPGRAFHNPRDDTSRIVAWTTGMRTWLAFPLSGDRSAGLPSHLRRPAAARRAGRRSAGRFRSAQLAAGVPRRVGADRLRGAAGRLWSIYIREIPRVLRSAGPRRRALVYALAGGSRGAQRPRSRQHDQHLLRARHAGRGVGAGPRATGPRCARGLNCCSSRPWPRAASPPVRRRPGIAGGRRRRRRPHARCRVHVTSSGNGRYTTLREMKHRRTIYIVRARSFVADTPPARARPAAGPSSSRRSPSSTATARARSRTRRRPS